MKTSPEYITKKVFSEIRKGKRSSWYENYFMVSDQKLAKWLEDKVIFTEDSAVTHFKHFKARFCWYSQKFLICP